MMRRAAGLLLAFAATAQGQVLIQPVVVQFAAKQKVVAVSLAMSERAAAPMQLQAQVLRWTQDSEGGAVTQPADDVLVSPAITQLHPGQRQVFRLALRNPQPAGVEKAYRLVLEDVAQVPADASGSPQAGLHIRMRYDLPVLVPPQGPPLQALQWAQCPTLGPQGARVASGPAADAYALACVRLLNAGNRRVRLHAVRVTGEGWQEDLPLKQDAPAILAGAQREFRFQLPPSSGGAIRGVQAQTTRGEVLRAEPATF
ncbi:fimbrial biogenesis chaperone [Ramlibacter albus]|uniref:Molecular chaperone n=1 Tax=Ramlibacter albus TaxID=2079448 RepID=A0A923S4J1_9BURK|nr:fimbria/pilus periplasmic chaperone [Ramlibacter albus]MBC5767659.1 molecular chaperone [Ramlibacter albus]